MKLKEKAAAYSGLLKTELPAAAGICVVAGQIIALGHFPAVTQLLLGFATGFLISGSAMASNDYFDLAVDKINHPERPLPSGQVSVMALTAFTIILSFCGFLAAAFLGIIPLVATIVIWTVGICYNWRIKESGLFGNATVAFSVASTFIFGGLTVGSFTDGLVWVFGGLAFLFDLGEEIANGAWDKEGDRQRSPHSLANLKSAEFATRTAVCLFAVFIALSFVPFVEKWLGYPYLAVMAAAGFFVSYFSFNLLRSHSPSEGRKQIRRLYLTLTIVVMAVVITRII